MNEKKPNIRMAFRFRTDKEEKTMQKIGSP